MPPPIPGDRPPTVRLLADDLTGALDSAARFVPLVGPIRVAWNAWDRDGSAAFDTGTRDADRASAIDALRRHTGFFAGADIAFKKIDSLLRGHVDAELRVCLPLFDHCVFAPAFPFQGRTTRNGRVFRRDGAIWRDVGVDLSMPPLDAETDADLDAIVARGRSLGGRVLWCGTGGLAGALADRRPVPRLVPRLVPPTPSRALIGSHHPTTLRQIAAAQDRKDAIVVAAIPPNTPRDMALRTIVDTFLARLSLDGRSGAWLVVGGETLRALCVALGADALEVDGEIEPGIPTSTLIGGAWNGQRIVSKSGAFGDDLFLARMLGV